MNKSFDMVDGKVKMNDLRTPDEIAQNIELTDQDRITRLTVKLVQTEIAMEGMLRDYTRMFDDLHSKIQELKPHAEFYQELQRSILDNPTLMSEWQRFCMFLKIADPDADTYNRL